MPAGEVCPALAPASAMKGDRHVYRKTRCTDRIRRAQSVGFNLAELKDLVATKVRSNRFPLEMAIEMIASKRQSLRNEMRRIQSLEQRLDELEDELDGLFGAAALADE